MAFAEEVLIPILAIVGFFASIIITVYMFFTSRNRIRLALIDQGKDASIFRKSSHRNLALRNGLVAVMVGAGLLTGYLLEKVGMPGFVAYTAMVLIFGGLGLIGYYVYLRNQPAVEEMV